MRSRSTPLALTAGLFLAAGLFLIARGGTTTASPPPIRVTITIIDAVTGAPVRATVIADDQRIALDVSEYTLSLPGDGLPHALRVEAPGYEVWGVKIAGELRPGHGVSGPVRLRRLPPGGSSSA